MLNKNTEKFKKQLHVILQKIFVEELNDVDFKRITINWIKFNNKKTFATIYIDILNISNKDKIFEKIKKLTPFFRQKISNYISKFRIPNLEFKEDIVFEKAMRIEKIIKKSLG